ncbi:MAG: hypothetical protein LBM27_01095 [Lactobacillaceae bacterium]|jgi:uncharacterized membrane protein YcgQ (UPF0703/DUF1980 family)|nr:hypothetical protein [Lactobacillaceae bacterium]
MSKITKIKIKILGKEISLITIFLSAFFATLFVALAFVISQPSKQELKKLATISSSKTAEREFSRWLKSPEAKSASIAGSESQKKAISEAEEQSPEAASSASERASSVSSSLAAKEDPANYQTGVTYEQIARNPKSFVGKKVQFRGKAIQVIETNSETQVRLAVNGDYDSVVYVEIDKSLLNDGRILENDLLTISGISADTITYDSTFGGSITLPAIIVEIVDDQGTSPDSYGY